MTYYKLGKIPYNPTRQYKQVAWWIVKGILAMGSFCEETALDYLVGLPNPRNGETPATADDVRWFLGHLVRHHRLERVVISKYDSVLTTLKAYDKLVSTLNETE